MPNQKMGPKAGHFLYFSASPVPWRIKQNMIKKLKIYLKKCSFSKMIDRNQVKTIICVFKKAPCRILTYLESRILKIVQKLPILQVMMNQGNFQDFNT